MDFVSLPYSPWSEKARWALDHHRVDYREREYLPLLGAPALRVKLRRLRGPITVPVLFSDDQVYADSYDIARYAESAGRGAPLFPAGADIDRWNRLSEQTLACSRALATARAADDPEVLKESVPRSIPGPIRHAFGRVGIRYLKRKYRITTHDRDDYLTTIRQALRELSGSLNDREYILGTFSYADVAMAVALQMVAPVPQQYIRLGTATRRCMTCSELTTEFPTLISWRDRIYEQHRTSPAT